jgi:hypothetical protein
VEPLNKGHFRDNINATAFVHCRRGCPLLEFQSVLKMLGENIFREALPFAGLFRCVICISERVNYWRFHYIYI